MKSYNLHSEYEILLSAETQVSKPPVPNAILISEKNSIILSH